MINLTRCFMLLACVTLSATLANAQNCTTRGQTPSTAFPVCGTSVFKQSSVPLCGGRKVPGPCAPVIDDRNPFFYRFTCFETGSLGFVITPNDLNSDYDWQLFDITNRNADDIYTDGSLFVGCNWSGSTGVTGASSAGNNLVVCDGVGRPLWSMMPTVEKGKTYLLLISHFSASQAGYSLEFKGGSAVITDTTKPEMKELQAGCGGTQFYLKLNKKMKCSSIAADGSDWEFVNSGFAIASAVGVGCANGFDTDSLIITTAGPLPTGTFALRSKKGSDGNTLLDLCDAPLAEGQTLVVNILPAQPSNLDSIKPAGCKPIELDVVMDEAILCSSIAANGSDFGIGGPQRLSIVGAAGVGCSNGLTKIIRLTLSAPITIGGVYTISTSTGSDGNTLLNACAKETPAGQFASTTASDPLALQMASQIRPGCTVDTIYLSLNNINPSATYTWHFDGQKFPGPNPISFTWSPLTDKRIVYGITGQNGVCLDSLFSQFDTKREILQADISTIGPAYACPDETIQFKDNSKGTPVQWLWVFGNGQTSNLQVPPPQQYPVNPVPGTQTYTAVLQVSDARGCTDTASIKVQVPNNCYIAVPTGFTPNGDGLNDFLYPLNAWKAVDLHFRVYNRFGQLIWETRDWTRKWDGTIAGKKADSGTFVWMLQYTDGVTGKKIFTKGTTVLVR